MTILSYIKFSLMAEADRGEFERDMHAMFELARRQAGFRWAEMGPSMIDSSVYLVVSEWDDVERVRSWAHEEEHAGVMQKWEPQYREPLTHQRFVPWVRPKP